VTQSTASRLPGFLDRHRAALVTLLALVLLPFLIGLLDGASPAAVLDNQSGNSKFIQGLAIEIFILALYALSFDLIFGITGLLSLAIPCSLAWAPT
jgi:branched-chain amino acid transport system permease protein